MSYSNSPHVRLVVLIGSTGENKGLVANILLVLIPEGKIYLKVQRWTIRSLLLSQLSKSLPARSILGLRRIIKRSNPCELPTFIAGDGLLHIWNTCLINFWKKGCRVLREYLCKHLNDMIVDEQILMAVILWLIPNQYNFAKMILKVIFKVLTSKVITPFSSVVYRVITVSANADDRKARK